jgi:hypothetical protein
VDPIERPHLPLLALTNPVPLADFNFDKSLVDLCWYDGPLIYISEWGGSQYYLHICDTKEGLVPPTHEDYFISRYLAVPISSRELDELRSSKLALRDLLRRDDQIIVADAHWDPDNAQDTNLWRCVAVSVDSLPDDYFPRAGVYLRGQHSNEEPANV